MNPKKIQDISESISKKTGIKKEEIEELHNFFFRVYLKNNLSDFGNIKYEIPFLGRFVLKYKNKKITDSLANLLKTKIKSVEPNSTIYNNMLYNIKKLEKREWETIQKIEDEKHKQRLEKYEQNKSNLEK